MRIEAFLRESPLFAVTSAARRFEALTAAILSDDNLALSEALVLAAIFFEAPRPVRPSALAETFGTTRGNISHCLSSLEAKDLLQRRIDPDDARAYRLTLRPPGRKAALRVIGAFDRLQRSFEHDAGKARLRDMLSTMHDVESALHRAAARERTGIRSKKAGAED